MTTEVRREGDPWWLAALGVVALLLLGVAVVGGTVLGFKYTQAARSAPAAIEAETLGDPRFGEVFAAFRDAYPDEFAALRDRIGRERAAGASQVVLQRSVAEQMLGAAARHRANLLTAPEHALRALQSSEAELLRAMEREDVRMCAAYVATAQRPRPEAAPEVTRATAANSAATWRAHAAGKASPVRRMLGPTLSQADAEVLVAMLRNKGMDNHELMALDNPRILLAMAPQQQCALGIKFSNALIAVPGEQGARIMAWMISRLR